MTSQTPALEQLHDMMNDVDSLIDHHPKAASPQRGKPAGSGQGPLMRACVAMIYTAWEVYAEESIIWGVEQLVQRPQPSDLPVSLRSWVSSRSADRWTLAGEGWRAATAALVVTEIRGDGDSQFGLNTASPGNVVALQINLLGEDLLKKVKWSGRTNTSVKKEIASLVTIRGEIVHKGATPGTLNLKGVRDWRDFVTRTAEHLDRHLIAFVVS